MKIAIIGSNGYIARNLTEFIKHEHTQVQLKLYDVAPESVDGHEEYSQVNILDDKSLSLLDLDCDVIYMFVGKTGTAQGFDDFNLYIDVNERALLNLLNEYRRQESKAKIVFPSSRLVYKGRKGLLLEDDEKEAKTIYAANKLACEKYLEAYSNAYDVKYCTVRICVPYGSLISGASSYGTAEFMLGKAGRGEDITLYGDGSQRRTLTYIGDLCAMLYKAGESDNCVNDVYNIGGENYSLRDMAERIADLYGVGVVETPWPDMAKRIESGDTVFDSRKLDSLIGDNIEMSFEKWINSQK